MKIKGAKILIESLINEGVDTVFCYPGGYVLDIFDELYQVQDKIKQVLTCHEQGAVHAADGYARISGKVGVVIATSGPGATNLVTGITNAYMDSIPLVAITGNVALSFLGRDSFQEVDIAGVTIPVTKHNYIVKDVRELGQIISDAFYIAKSGRPGPVLIDIPKNIQQAECEWEPIPVRKVEYPKPDINKAKAAIDLINSAKKPLIYLGGGCISSGAHKQVLELAEKIDAPVACSMMGLGGFPASHPLFMGMIGMHGHANVNFSVQECDTLIALGARFSDRVATDRNKFVKGKVVHIDIDNAEINKNVNADAHILGDLKTVLETILPYINERKNPEWIARCNELKRTKVLKETFHKVSPREILRSISKNTPDDQIIVTDVGQHQMWTAQTCSFEKPRTFVTSGGLGAMGFGMGAAIGSAIASKKRVVLVTGDGSFHMNFNEVVTAVVQNLPIAIFVMNNNTLGMVRQWQKLFYKHRFSNTTLNRPTNYEYLAKAFGADYLEINDNSHIDEIVKKAVSCEKPVIVNCLIGMDDNVLPMIPSGKSVSDMIMEIGDTTNG
ncbi:MAG TPA: biosynthetic-type acetolactate synthase large subunit [Clostridia bacterium]